jgi:hypothetical protein
MKNISSTTSVPAFERQKINKIWNRMIARPSTWLTDAEKNYENAIKTLRSERA